MALRWRELVPTGIVRGECGCGSDSGGLYPWFSRDPEKSRRNSFATAIVLWKENILLLTEGLSCESFSSSSVDIYRKQREVRRLPEASNVS